MSETATEKSTRERLIEAAGELFAEKGFKETTVRDISERADANLAAVNYHFGDKEKLYEEVVLYIINGVREEFPVDMDIDKAASPQARLHTFVRNMLYRFIDPSRPAWRGALFARERMNPRPAVLSIIQGDIMKVLTLLSSIIYELLGPGAEPEEVGLCGTSIMGQIIFQAHIRSPNAPPLVRMGDITVEEIRRLVQHITDFSLAGIEDVRKTREESAGKER